MVCKESLCSWFKHLSPHKRIDIMCGMLHMCLPMELRFMGSFVEDLAKKDFNHLREAEGKANNRAELSNFCETDAKIFRTKMAIYLALLHSSNRNCSNTIYKLLEANIKNAFTVQEGMDDLTIHHILLVLVMAMNHPAFSYHQKTRMCEQYQKAVKLEPKPPQNLACTLILEESCDMRLGDAGVMSPASSPRIPPIPTSPQQHFKAHVLDIELLNTRQIEKEKLEYRLRVTWSNGKVKEVYKTFQELHNFHATLLDMFPEDSNPLRQDSKLPSLPDLDKLGGTPERIINSYFSSLLQVPKYILESDEVNSFFQEASIEVPIVRSCQDASTSPRSQGATSTTTATLVSHQQSISGDDESLTPNEQCFHLKPMTVYNSQLDQGQQSLSPASHLSGMMSLSPRSPTHPDKMASNAGTSSMKQMYPSSISPCTSPVSSYTESPVNSRSTSPGPRTDIVYAIHCDDLERAKEGEIPVKSRLDLPQQRLSNGLPEMMSMQYGIPALHPISQMPWPPSPNFPLPGPHGNLQTVPHMFLNMYGIPSGLGPQESSPLNSEHSSPSPSPDQKCHLISQTQTDSSSDDNEKGKRHILESINPCRRPDNHPSLIMSSSTSHLEDRQKDDRFSTGQLSDRNDNQRAASKSNSSGYQSDPTPCYLQRTSVMRPSLKAQPAHTHIRIPLKHVVNMPDCTGNVKHTLGYKQFPMAQPQVRESTMTTTGSAAYSIASSDSMQPQMYMGQNAFPRFQMNTNTNWSMSATQPPPVIGKTMPVVTGNLPNSSSVMNQPSIPVAAHACANVHELGNNTSQPSVDLTATNRLQMGLGGNSLGNSTSVTLTTSSLPTMSPVVSSSNPHSCTTCGCHQSLPPTPYPYHLYLSTGAMPFPQTNGIPPGVGPFQTPMYFPQPQLQYMNGLNQDFLINSAHHAGYNTVNHPGTGGVSPNVGYGYNVCNSHQNQGYSMTQNSKPKKRSCHNCGSPKHIAVDCTENSMESMSGHFHFTYKPKTDSD